LGKGGWGREGNGALGGSLVRIGREGELNYYTYFYEIFIAIFRGRN